MHSSWWHDSSQVSNLPSTSIAYGTNKKSIFGLTIVYNKPLHSLTRPYKFPGPFANGLTGAASSVLYSVLRLSGVEVIGFLAGESKNASTIIVKSYRIIFWVWTTISLFYMAILGLLVPHSDVRLLTNSGLSSSPFAIIVEDNGLSRIIIGILTAVLLKKSISGAIIAIYGSSRALFALAKIGYAPRILMRVSRRGHPTAGLVLHIGFSLLAFIFVTSKTSPTLEAIITQAGCSPLLVWISIFVSHLRSLRHWHHIAALKPLYGVFSCVVILICQWWMGFAAAGLRDIAPSNLIGDFWVAYISLPLIGILYIVTKLR